MNALIVFAHPEPRSFNAAMRDEAARTLAEQGYSVTVSDLYAEGFEAAAGPGDVLERANPERFDLGAEQLAAAETLAYAPDIRREIDRLFAADLLILQFPMWWFSVPAILKGWIDRVFAFGVAYDFGRTWDRGVFRGKRAMLSFTTGAPANVFEPDGRSGDLERVLWPLHGGVLALCGFSVLRPFTAWAVPWIGDQGRAEVLARYRRRLQSLDEEEPLFFHRLADFGEDHRLRPDVEPGTPAQHRGPRKHL
ncbi:MAG: flavodoxin family protein [Gammaproteobacteria bacterium]|nr:MAG: flavodoxin family protein [Gammaproteobacteria bacterium]